MGVARTAVVVAAAAFAGAALAGLPPVRDGLDRLSERVERAARAPRRADIARGVRWYLEDARWPLSAHPLTSDILRARIRALRPRERAVYAEAARRAAARRTRTADGYAVLPFPTGPLRIPFPPRAP